MLHEASALLEAAEKIEAGPGGEGSSGNQTDGLQQRNHVDKTIPTMEHGPEFGLAVSRGKALSSDSPLIRVANAAGLSIPQLAAAVAKRLGRPVGKSTIKVAYLRRRCRRDLAEAIQEETRSKEYPMGFAATAKNWGELFD